MYIKIKQHHLTFVDTQKFIRIKRKIKSQIFRNALVTYTIYRKIDKKIFRFDVWICLNLIYRK